MKAIRPSFLHKIGHKAIAYILNVDEEEAKNILNNPNILDESKKIIYNHLIDYSRQIRLQGLDHDVDFFLRHQLANTFKTDGVHLFTYWHKQAGGIDPEINYTDPVVSTLCRLALVIYPVQLLNNNPFSETPKISASIYHLQEYKNAVKAISNDETLMKLFPNVSSKSKDSFEYEVETFGYYRTSNGRGGTIQLASFPDLIINNSFLLSKLRSEIKKQDIMISINEVVEYIRCIISGKEISLPLFYGFLNIGFKEIKSLETELGTFIPYNQNWVELLPRACIPPIRNPTEYIGFILKNKYSLKANIFSDPVEFDKKLTREYQTLNERDISLQQKVCLILAFSIEHDFPIGTIPNWTLYFNPLSGMDISWREFTNATTTYLISRNKDIESIQYWAPIINNVTETKLRIALDRVVKSLTDQRNPESAFLEAIIALDSLFGDTNEITFKISMSVARLLGNTEEERTNIQRSISKLYNLRSSVVHGIANLKYNEAQENKNECLRFVLACLKKIYVNKELGLIECTSVERSKKILLA